MKKVFSEKNEEIPAIVERVITAGDDEVVLVIPKDAIVKGGGDNFSILKREAEEAGKHLIIESVDNEVLGMAHEEGIDAYHPLFKGAKAKSLSDIIRGGIGGANETPEKEKEIKAGTYIGANPEMPSRAAKPAKSGGRRKLKIEEEQEGEEEETEQAPTVTVVQPRINPRQAEQTRFPGEEGSAPPPERKEPFFKDTPPPPQESDGSQKRGLLAGKKKYILLGIGVCALIGGGVAATNHFFGKATVTMTFAPIPWAYSGTITVTKTASAVDKTGNVVPGEYLNQEKNSTQFYAASGRSNVSQKATGKITIFNAYSSESQPLVATTRFQTPDGKVFRIDKAVTVPGAQIKDGKIIPSSIVADVTADKPGVEYNVGPIEKLTIPGFSGTPKFAGFYGELKEPTTGGFIGDRATPTEDDVKSAEEKTREVLKASLESGFMSNRPEDFTVIEGTSDIAVTRLTVNKNTDDSGNFSVFGEARYQAVAFREDDVRALLLGYAHDAHAGTVFRDITLSYKDARVNFDKGELTVTVDAEGSLVPEFDANAFKKEIGGLAIDAARSRILELPQLGEAKISLWPVWLSTIPKDEMKMTITVQ